MIIMGQWTRVENNNVVFLRVTNHTGQGKKNLLGRLGFEPATFGLLVRRSTNWATGQVGSWSSNDGILGLFDISNGWNCTNFYVGNIEWLAALKCRANGLSTSLFHHFCLIVRYGSEKHHIIILHPSSLSHNNHLNLNVWRLLSRYWRN